METVKNVAIGVCKGVAVIIALGFGVGLGIAFVVMPFMTPPSYTPLTQAEFVFGLAVSLMLVSFGFAMIAVTILCCFAIIMAKPKVN